MMAEYKSQQNINFTSQNITTKLFLINGSLMSCEKLKIKLNFTSVIASVMQYQINIFLWWFV